MAEKDYFTCIDMATFALSGLGASYAALNGTGFSDSIKVLKIYNGGTVGVTISYDGITDHDIYPASSTFVIDLQTNHANDSQCASGTKYGRKGQIIYGKGTAGTGTLYIVGYK